MKTGSTVAECFATLIGFVAAQVRLCVSVCVLTTLLVVNPAWGQIWDERANAGADAGPKAPQLQLTYGVGPLGAIAGRISNPDVDIDMYCIKITSESTFSATFDESTDSLKRFSLWLFDSSGRPVAHAEDNSFPYHAAIDSTHVLANGTYFLAISVYTFQPRDASNAPLFPAIASGQTGKNPLAGPIATWFGSGCCGGGSYGVKLTGADYHSPPLVGGPGTGPCWTYTDHKHFSQGYLFNLSAVIDPESGDQCLRLDDPAVAWPFVAMPISAASPRDGAVMRIAVENMAAYGLNEGDVVGEYSSKPGSPNGNPSRTTIDPYGNVWVGNRDDNIPIGGGVKGSVARFGLVRGGTRWNKATGLADPNGDYLKGPFQYCTCEDRDKDGLIKTTRGYKHTSGLPGEYVDRKMPWPSGLNTFLNRPLDDAEDECITAYVRVAGNGVRHISIDPSNNIWTGGFLDHEFEKLDGSTAQVVPSSLFLGPVSTCGTGSGRVGGYGGVVDSGNVIWSANWSTNACINQLTRVDPITGPKALNIRNYGVALDPCDLGSVWTTAYVWDNLVREVLPNGTQGSSFPHSTSSSNKGARGLVVHNGEIWVAHSGSNTVGRRPAGPGAATDITLQLPAPLINGSGATGVTVDTNGKIWTGNRSSNNSMRINPATSKVDLAVDLGTNALPYNYADSTGNEHLRGSAPQGSWTVVHDGGAPATPWGKLSWSSHGDPGTGVLVRVRATDSVIPSGPWTNVANGVAFTGVIGRYLQVQVTLTRPPSPNCGPGAKIEFCDLVICKEPGCYVKLGEVVCKPSASGSTSLSINATITNNTGRLVKKILVSPSIGSPVSFAPHSIPVTIPQGQSAAIQTTATGWTEGQEFCFTVTLVDETNQTCCSAELCVKPDCDCLQIPEATDTVTCDLLTGDFIYSFKYDNLTPQAIYHLYLEPPAGIVFVPDYFQFASGIAPGASSGVLTVRIKNASLGQKIPFLMSIHYLYLGECCSRSLTITMPTTCGDFTPDPGGCCPTWLRAQLAPYSAAWMAHPTVTFSIMNAKDHPAAFDWSATELPMGVSFNAELSPGSISPPGGSTPVIPPGGSFDVTLSLPAGTVLPNERAGIRAAIFEKENAAPYAFATGEVLGALEFDLGTRIARSHVRAGASGVQHAPVGVPTLATFEITNAGLQPELYLWEILGTEHFVSLEGNDPGIPYSGQAVINPGATLRVPVLVTIMHDPETAIPVAVMRVKPFDWYPSYSIGASTSFRSGASCPADFNADGIVDDADFPIFVFAYNLLACADPSMPVGCPADLNGDNLVDDGDFAVFVEAYNIQLCP